MGASLESCWALLKWALRRWTAHSINFPTTGALPPNQLLASTGTPGRSCRSSSPSQPLAQAAAPGTSQPFPLLCSTWEGFWAPILSESWAPPALASSKFLAYKFTAVSGWVWTSCAHHFPLYEFPLDPLQLQPSVISWLSIPYLLTQHLLAPSAS